LKGIKVPTLKDGVAALLDRGRALPPGKVAGPAPWRAFRFIELESLPILVSTPICAKIKSPELFWRSMRSLADFLLLPNPAGMILFAGSHAE
jgi:hypothetical protein